MHRRTFVGALGALGFAQAATEKRTSFLTVQHMKLRNGTELPRLHDFFSQTVLPALNRIHAGPKIYLEAMIAPHTPQLTVIQGFSSLEEMWEMHTKIRKDEALGKSIQALEASEPAFESIDSSLVEATDFSPEIKIEASAATRIFELRVYHAATWRQLGSLEDRFRGPEIKIFHRCGIHPILYGTTLFGADTPNLTYLIPFADLAAREKAWNMFNADPEWQKVRKESIEKAGQMVTDNNIAVFKATPYSPIR
jgi:hypothetical protein